MNTEAKKGGCQCGDIRYELSGEPVTCYACHCTEWTRTAAWLLARSDGAKSALETDEDALTLGAPLRHH